MSLRGLILAKQLAVSLLAVVVFAVLSVDILSFRELDGVKSLANRSITLADELAANVGALDLSSGLSRLGGLRTAALESSSMLGNAFTVWLADIADAIAQYATDLYRSFTGSWSRFLGLGDSQKTDELVGTPQDVAALKAQIKQEVYNELKQEMLNRPGFVGVSAFPSTGSTSSDLSRTKSIEQMFSDRVDVQVSPDGKSGTVKPIFRDRLGGNYLFLLSPNM